MLVVLIFYLDRNQFYMSANYNSKFGPEASQRVKDITIREGFFLSLAPFEGAVEAMQHLDGLPGVQVMICTSPLTAYQFCVKEKFDWIEKHLGSTWTSRIICTRDKTVVHGDILIDDRPVINGFNTSPTWEHVYFDQPYNRNSIGSKRRIQSWHDLEALTKLINT